MKQLFLNELPSPGVSTNHSLDPNVGCHISLSKVLLKPVTKDHIEYNFIDMKCQEQRQKVGWQWPRTRGGLGRVET